MKFQLFQTIGNCFPSGKKKTLLVVSLFLASCSLIAQPANDNFGNRIAISGSYGTVTGTTAGATIENREVSIGGVGRTSRSGSIWYKWTAPASGTVRFDTMGSGYDTLLSAFTGTVVSSLTSRAANDNYGSGTQSRIAFAVISGTEYQIGVDGRTGNEGSVVLNYRMLPAVALTSDPAATVAAPGAPVTLTANVTPYTGTVSSVTFYSDSVSFSQDTTSPYSAVWSSSVIGNHALRANATDDLGEVVQSTNMTIGIMGIQLTAPANGAKFLSTNAATLSANAFMTNGAAISAVQFYANDVFVGSDDTAPYSMVWSNIPGGNYLIYSVMAGDNGMNLTSAPVVIAVGGNIVPRGSLWKFSDIGVDLGTDWRLLTYDDSSWSSGLAELGYGDGDEVTTNQFGADTNNKYPTVYYRRAFVVDNPSTVGSLTWNFKRDDGIVVYLNGIEVFRDNMPDGAVSYGTVTVNAPDDGGTWWTTNSSASLLLTGNNVIAAEIHQAGTAGQPVTSSDISFNLELLGAPVANQAPQITLLAVTNTPTLVPAQFFLSASASDADGQIRSVSFFNGSTLLKTVTQPPYTMTWSNVPQGTYNLTAVAYDNLLASSTSAVVVATAANVLVGLTTPVYGTWFRGTAPIPMAASVAAGQGISISRVEFVVDGAVVATQTSAPYTMPWTNVTSGIHFLRAQAVDQLGTVSYSDWNAIGVFGESIVRAGSFWRYLDNGSDQGVDWTMLAFDDSAWATGQAQLGYGDGDEVTTNSYGPEINNKYVTTYYRQQFDVPNHGNVTNLYCRFLRDDGIVVYLNGVELLRNNMPDGTIGYRTSASVSIEETIFHETNLSPGLLIEGTNQIAVEIHQYGTPVTSSDISMDLELIAERGSNQIPSIVLTSPAAVSEYTAPATIQLQATAADADGAIKQVEFFQGLSKLGNGIFNGSAYTLVWSNVSVGDYQVYAIAGDSVGGSATSAVASVTVTAGGAVWTAFNDHVAGAATSPNATAWNVLGTAGGTPGNTGFLKDITSGTVLGVSVTVTRNGGSSGGTSGAPNPGTPAGDWFRPYVDFGSGTVGDALQQTVGQVVTYAFSGLNPARRYTFKGTAARGGSTYLDRWSLITILAASQRAAHVPAYSSTVLGVLTSVEVPESLQTNQAAYNSGYNSTVGAMVDWEEIVPNADGTLTITDTQYAGTVPNGQTTAGTYGYAFMAWSLAEVATSSQVSIASPANDTEFTVPANIAVQADAIMTGGISNVVFYGNGAVLGQDALAPFTAVWNDAPVGTNELIAVAYSLKGLVMTSAVVRVSVKNPAPNAAAPVISSVTPLSGPVNSLNTIQVNFSEPVVNVDASDLLLNGQPAQSVTGSGSSYTFTFSGVACCGLVQVSWAANHGIQDVAYDPLPFDAQGVNATWTYNFLDGTAPTIAAQTPAAGTAVSNLTTLSVTFSEAVIGVNASDLLINGNPAIGLTGSGASYTFSFPMPLYGAVSVAWVVNHGITDMASPANAFDASGKGATWSYTHTAPVTVLIPTNSFWRMAKGTNEASSPVTAWRQPEFDDSNWLYLQAPFFYDNNPSPVLFTGNTHLTDMYGVYLGIYLRQSMVVNNVQEYKSLTFRSAVDDGLLLWVNGTNIWRSTITAPGEVAYNQESSCAAQGEPTATQTITFTNVASILRPGTNVIAIQAMNTTFSSSDFIVSLEMSAVIESLGMIPPSLASVTPFAGEVYNLTNITVAFTEPVTGVDAGDLLVNGVPALSVSGSNAVYTFHFVQPAYGLVSVTWVANPGIVDYDAEPRAFNAQSPAAMFQYQLINPNAPVIVDHQPATSTVDNILTNIHVTFSKPVTGVDAADLQVNGVNATGISGSGSTYNFSFAQPSFGLVTVSWQANHGIMDLDVPANAFDNTRPGSTWQYTLLDKVAPVVVSQTPAAGSNVTNLTQLTVVFSEPVVNVDAADLLVNGVPASSRTGSGTTWTFHFAAPNATLIQVSWAVNHGIQDASATPNSFDAAGTGATWQYRTLDLVPPTTVSIQPQPGTTIRQLSQITVVFNESVTGVQAGSLRVNGTNAVSVMGSGAGPYTFNLPSVTTGLVQIAWAPSHGIQDLALPANNFGGGSWTYDLNPDASFADRVVFSEIMFNSTTFSTNDEWLEIYNKDSAPVNLTGWRISKGVNYVFGNVILPGKSHIVVAADLATFRAKYPTVSNVVGNWVGQLSNSDEDLELDNADGVVINRIHYATEGDWAIRRIGSVAYVNGYRGWEWYCEADGLGKTLELVDTEMPNQQGQNWHSSSTVQGTPGVANSIASTNIAPMILNFKHWPTIPAPTDSVAISATIVDEDMLGVSVSLYWRNASSLTPGAWNSTPMFDDGAHGDGAVGDGVYGAIIPAQANLAIIEYYVSTLDAQGAGRSYPAAANDLTGASLGQVVNAVYQVDDSGAKTYGQPVYRFVMTATEREQLRLYLANDNISAMIDAQANATFVARDTAGTDVRYSVSMRSRGNGTRGARPNNMRIDIPDDNRWRGFKRFNLNSQYTHSQVVGSAITRMSGMPSEDAFFVRVRMNAVDPANAGLSQFGCFVHITALDGDFVERHFPNDANGNLYRCMRTAALVYYPNPVSYTTGGNNYAKVSNVGANDWSDLQNMTYVLNNAPASNFLNAVSQVMDVDEWVSYFAVLSLVGYNETAIGSDGTPDDYTMYCGETDRRFRIFPHDHDTDFGEGDSGRTSTSLSIFRATTDAQVNLFLKNPQVAPLYYGKLKQLLETVFVPSAINATLDQLLTGVVPKGAGGTAVATIDGMKWWMGQRITNVWSQINLNFGITSFGGMAQANGFYQSTSANVTLLGRANVVNTRKVVAGGVVGTYSAWEGTWSANVALQPGINQVVLRALGTNDVEVDRTVVDIWYSGVTGQSVSGTINANTTWSPASGPYRVTANLTVASGATLTILPGTTVYLSSGVGITVASGGKLLAMGTEDATIHFTSEPGTGIQWGGIVINGAAGTPESRISYAHIENNNTIAIHTSGATAWFDHLTFGTTTKQYLSLDASSFVVADCYFPTPTAVFEPAHGSGGIKAGGRALFIRNYFGAPNGYSDVIDFTGGNRPGPIVQFIDNVFMGSGDDVLDLDSTDAWVEGNIFMHVHKNGSPDSSSAVSGGNDDGNASEITVAGNIFFNCDQLALAKQSNYYVIANNTMVKQTKVGGTETDAGVVRMADAGVPGVGAWLEGNILYDLEELVAEPSTSRVVFTNNLMSLNWTGLGGGNISADPGFVKIPTIAETAFTNWAQAQVMKKWLSLKKDSVARGMGINGLDQGGAIPLGASVSGVPSGVEGTGTAVLTVGMLRSGGDIGTVGWPNGSGYTHYKWRLDGGAWSAETPTTQPITLTGLNAGSHYVEVSGKRDCGMYQDDAVYGVDAVVTRTPAWTVLPGALSVRLSEIMAANDHAVSYDGGYPDYVELKNEGRTGVDLGGMRLTTNPLDPNAYVVPAGTLLGAGQYLMIYGGNGSGLRLGFNLQKTGEHLYLYDSVARGGALVDELAYGMQVSDYSVSKLADGQWGLSIPTAGSANRGVETADAHLLKINEWLSTGGVFYDSDFVELYNPQSLPVALGGLYLTDIPDGWRNQHQVAPLSFIASHGYTAFLADGNIDQGPDHLNFNLRHDEGMIALSDPGLNIIDVVEYALLSPDLSQGRSPNGSATISIFTQPTPGSGNQLPLGTTNITSVSTNLIAMNAVWKYDATGTNLGTGWVATNYNDTSWSNGPALLHGLIAGGSTTLPVATVLPTLNSNKLACYFRTTFVFHGSQSGASLSANYYLDDGAVIYLNGQEWTRLNMPSGTITYATLAANNVSGDSLLNTVTMPTAAFQDGTNYIAVEVHQSAATSTDMAWAFELNLVRSSTNLTGVPVVINEVLANSSPSTNHGGIGCDWVELHNPGQAQIDLSGYSLSDDFANPMRWVFPSGTVLPGLGYVTVRCNPDLPASTNYSSILNTGYGLKANGGKLGLFNAVTNGSSLVDSIQYGIQVEDYSISRIPSGGMAWNLSLPTLGGDNIGVALGDARNIRINEWMPRPKSGDDWFELYNPNSQPVALGGLSVTDDLNNPLKHTLPTLSFMGASTNGYLVLNAGNNYSPEGGANNVNFKLDNTAESIGLALPSGQFIDRISYQNLATGVSGGRFPDGSDNIVSFDRTVSQGEANYLWLTSVVINEALTHTDPPLEDAIELYNTTGSPINIGGWYLSDAKGSLRKYQIPQGSTIAAHGYAVFYENQFNSDPIFNPAHSFALSSSKGDEIYLSEANSSGDLSGYRTSVKFAASQNGVSFGRYVTSQRAEEFVSMSQPTFGISEPGSLEIFRQGLGGMNTYPKVGPVVISEIMYHPTDVGTNDNSLDEFIELRNLSTVDVALYDLAAPTNGWRLRDAVTYDFPSGTMIPAGGYVLVVNFNPWTNLTTLAAFRTAYGLGTNVALYGPYGGKLANSDAKVELWKPDAPEPDMVPYVLVERVHYADVAPWPVAADGAGYSLSRLSLTGFGNDPTNWVAAVPTPGQETIRITAQPANLTVSVGSNAVFEVKTTPATGLNYQWFKGSTSVTNSSMPSLVIPTVALEDDGEYHVVVSGYGMSVTSQNATLTVVGTVLPSGYNRIGLQMNSQTPSVFFVGNPGVQYRLLFSRDLKVWDSITNIIADAQGQINCMPTNSVGNAGFYRMEVVQP